MDLVERGRLRFYMMSLISFFTKIGVVVVHRSTIKSDIMIDTERAHELKEIVLAKYTTYLEAEIKFVVENEYAEVVDARG